MRRNRKIALISANIKQQRIKIFKLEREDESSSGICRVFARFRAPLIATCHMLHCTAGSDCHFLWPINSPTVRAASRNDVSVDCDASVDCSCSCSYILPPHFPPRFRTEVARLHYSLPPKVEMELETDDALSVH